MHLGAADALLEKLPAKPRALAQVAHLLALLFGSTAVAALGLSRWVEVGLSAALVVWGVALVRPLSEWRAGRLARALLLPLGLLAAVGGGLLVGSPLFAERPVLGIGMKDLAEGVQVTSVHPGFPAEGTLVVGDELLAVDGNSLGKARPSHELRRLVRDRTFAASGSARLSLRRGGLATEVTLAIPERRALNLPPLLLAALRALAVLLATFVFLKSDAQGLHHLGLRRAGAAREAAWAVPGLFFTYSVHLGVSIVVGVALLVSRGMGSQLKERSEGIAAIESLTASIPAPALLLALVWLAAFEEVVLPSHGGPHVQAFDDAVVDGHVAVVQEAPQRCLVVRVPTVVVSCSNASWSQGCSGGWFSWPRPPFVGKAPLASAGGRRATHGRRWRRR